MNHKLSSEAIRAVIEDMAVETKDFLFYAASGTHRKSLQIYQYDKVRKITELVKHEFMYQGEDDRAVLIMMHLSSFYERSNELTKFILTSSLD